MSTKSILKQTVNVDAEVEVKVEVDDDIVSIQQDGGGVPGSKKIQIKKQESIDTSTSAKKPTLKITKKKVVITEQQQPETSLLAEKVVEVKEQEVLVDIVKALKVSKKPIKKQDITEMFNDDDVDYRYIITNYDFSKNKTLPKITRYEKALLVGKRAKQIEEGANPNVKVLPGQTSIDIAEEELRQRRIPFIIKRPIGNKFEYWKPKDMEVIMD